jgi:uncharacterized membrane protein
MNKHSVLLLLSLIIFLGVTLSVFRINRSLWLDEAFSVYVAEQGVHGIISSAANDSSPPFYYMILSIWIKCFGNSEISIRALSTVFYLLGIIVIYKLSASIFDSRLKGLLCAFLLMVSPLAVDHAQNGRMYALLCLLTIVSLFLFLKIFLGKTNSIWLFTLYIVINTIGTFTHYYFFFVLFAQVISVLTLAEKRTRCLLSIFISILPFLLLWMPIQIEQMHSGATSWITKPNLYALRGAILYFYGGRLSLVIYAIVLVLIVFKIDKRIAFRSLTEIKEFFCEKRLIVLLIFFLTSLLTPWFISQLHPIFHVRRSVIIALPPLATVTAVCIAKFVNKRFFVLITTVFIILSQQIWIKDVLKPENYSDRTTAQYLSNKIRTRDVMIFTSLSRLSIEYYMKKIGWHDSPIMISYPNEITSHPGWRDVKSMLDAKDRLEQEADRLIDSIRDLPTYKDTVGVWLFYGFDTKIGNIIKNKLESQFTFEKQLYLKGSFFTSILKYNAVQNN